MNSKAFSPASEAVPSAVLASGRWLDFSSPAIMYIINLTENSFSDGGRFSSHQQAIESALAAEHEGANILDLGAESTRPGATPVSSQQQIDRILPVLQGIRQHSNIPISVDTSDRQVIQVGIAAGADIINDVRALTQEGALAAAAESGAALCLMHMQGTPETMQHNPTYANTTEEVKAFFYDRVQACLDAGINKQRIILDPGFGFGKTLEDNVELMNNLPYLAQLGYPLLVGVSRKSMLGTITGRNVHQRQFASVAAGLMALERGANILRVHDLAPTIDALAVYNAINKRTH